ncbi:brefeldin A-inhibited guanine nucleotide-exchange protein 3-like isoform X3 [Apostichopus japonicus]|uniref:brefeldin A-inhibited guanine nucleotide-exchange protein 3-like isoform X3 n=1 Tax=Stichopus japonicus TaxID=307972 RepID=UPI003AB593AA
MPSGAEEGAAMEEILSHIVQEATHSSKLTALKEAATQAKATLLGEKARQSKKASELRQICLLPIKLALEAKNNKVSNLGVTGLQKILAENRFQSLLGDENETEDDVLVNQVLEALVNTPNMNEDVQVEMIKLLLVMTCSAGCKMDVKSLLRILEPKQMIESSPTKENPSKGETNMADIIEVVSFLCTKVSETHKSSQVATKPALQENQLLTLQLEAIHTTLSNVLQKDGENQDFQKCIWQELCPTLIGILGIPKDEKAVIAYCSTATPSQNSDSENVRGVLEHGRGSSSLSQGPVKFKSARQVIFAIASELLRCFGRVESMRTVLASLYHRILLFPPPSQRNEALKMVAEVISTPEKLLDIAMPPSIEDNPRKDRAAHLDLLKLLIDGITEAAESKISHVSNTSVKCIYSLLTSLEQLHQGQGIRPQQADIILKYFQSQEKEDSHTLDGMNASSESEHESNSKGHDGRTEKQEKDEDDLGEREEAEGATKDEMTNVCNPGVNNISEKSKAPVQGLEMNHQRNEMKPSSLGGGGGVGELVLDGLSSRSDEIAKMQAEGEKQGARDYADGLVALLPRILGMMDVTEVDEALQQFASKFVAGYTMKKPISDHSESQTSQKLNLTPVINADGIYVSTCYGLLLNMKLLMCDHYNNPGNLPLTQKQFVDGVHSSGVLVYLSATWLGELYRILITRDLLGEAGYHLNQEISGGGLRTFLKDIDGMGSQAVGGQLLQEASFLYDQSAQAFLADHHPAPQAGSKFTRHILTAFWQNILSVLSVPISTNLSVEVKGQESSSKESKSRDEDVLCLSLDGLRKAAELTCKLGLQKRCAGVFAHLAEASCTDTGSDSSNEKGNRSRKVWPSRTPSGMRLHAVHALSMDAILSMGVEMGSHSAECWKHVFRCCAYVSQLEHTQFTKDKGVPSPQTIIPKVNDSKAGEATFDLGNLDSAPAYTPVSLPPDQSDFDSDQSVQDIVKKEKMEKGFEISSATGALLAPSCASKVLCSLSSSVDRLFEEAALKLNLKALLSFLQELCAASQLQLYNTYPTQKKVKSLVIPTSPSKSVSTSDKAETSLHLYRMGDVILKCVRQSSRPLLHLMQAWSMVAPHLVEAACHKDRHVSKRATAIIHDVLTEIFTCKMELDYFHFHEALLKPFESLLCLELCDSDVQDQVVTSICELVEASFTNIKSGWRPLFGALRAVRFSQSAATQEASGDHSTAAAEHPLAPVCNVFEAFLNTDNAAVFANAAIDCILCLLKFVRSTGCDEASSDSPPPTFASNGPFPTPPPSPGDRSARQVSFDMCLPALNYLHRCHKILATIYSMPAHPLFRGSQSIKLGASETVSQSSAPQSPVSLQPEAEKCGPILFQHVLVESVDDDSGLMRVWFLLLEGLTGAVSTCPQKYQPPTLELLYEVLNSIIDTPGEEFAIFAVTELLLPMMQSWVRRNRHVHSTWDFTTSNFKHACGLTTDLVVNYFSHLLPSSGDSVGVPLILRQFLDLMVECICQANESVARLGCSCIRHMCLSVGPVFTQDLWTVACRGMQRAVAASLRSIKQLIACFHPGSEEFLGDTCQVKVAARRDVTEEDYLRLQQLAQQVFLVESQRHDVMDLEADEDSIRSFIFIIYPPDADINMSIDLIKNRIQAKVSFRSVVLGLLAHQLLIQTLGTILLHGSESSLSTKQNIMTSGLPGGLARQDSSDSHPSGALPGLLPYLSAKNLSLLMECFVQSYQTAFDFNARPGLKFLLQKVAKFEVAVNLYWQAGMSFTFYLHTLLEVCHHIQLESMDKDHIKGIIKSLGVDRAAADPVPPSGGGKEAQQGVESGSEDGHGQEIRPRSQTADSTTSTGNNSSRGRAGSEPYHLASELTFNPTDASSDDLANDLSWIIKRLFGICNEVSSFYIQMHLAKSQEEECLDRTSDLPLFFLVAPKALEFQPVNHSEDPDREEEEEEGKDDERVEENGDDEEHEGEEGHSDWQTEGGDGATPDEEGSKDDGQDWKFASHWSPKLKCVQLSEDEQIVDVLHKKAKKRKKGGKSPGNNEGSSLYTVATKKTIKSLMQEYKKRKNQHSRSVFVKKPTFKEQKYIKLMEQRDLSLTPDERKRRREIQEEQKSSIMRDTEAMITTWSEMILTLLQLLQLLPDDIFQRLLPVVFPSVSQLICHVTNGKVRSGILEFMERVALLNEIV